MRSELNILNKIVRAMFPGVPSQKVRADRGVRPWALPQIIEKVLPGRQEETAKLESQKLKQLVRAIATTRPDEIGCDECFEKLDCFVEMALAGKDAADAMPLVQDHLDRCRDCREEFEALLAALHVIS